MRNGQDLLAAIVFAALAAFVLCLGFRFSSERQYQGVVDKAIASAQAEQPAPKARSLEQEAYDAAGVKVGGCVLFVQYFLHQLDDCQYVNCETKPFRGVAGTIRPNTTEPGVGRAVLLREGAEGHAAVVVRIIPKGGLYPVDRIVLAESNYYGDGVVWVGRKLWVNDKRIRGYYQFP